MIMKKFYIGQKLICTNTAGWYHCVNKEQCDGPDYLEEVIVVGFNPENYLILKGYSVIDGYNPLYFKSAKQEKYPLMTFSKIMERSEMCNN